MSIIIIDSFKNTVFDPLSIAGCDLWLDAMDATTINAGSPTDLDAVSTWADKSTAGNDATQGTGVNQPTWNDSGSITFTSPNQLTIASSNINTDTTWFLVLHPTDVGNRQVIYVNNGSVRVSITDGGFLYRTSTNYTDGQSKTTSLVLISGYVDRTTPSVDAYKDKVASTGSSSNSFSGGTGFALSGRTGGPTLNPLEGDIMEILRYDSALSTANRQAVENYLSTKHGTP